MNAEPSALDAVPAAPHVTLSLCGDVMTGRGVDQVLSHPGDPRLHESFVKDAREYVRLAEQSSGPIPKPVDDAYVWGDALAEWRRVRPDFRIVNLETSVTSSEDYWPTKEVHYRMHPINVGCLRAARLDCCALANNHVVDWGWRGFAETLETLHRAGLKTAGAGGDLRQAQAPVVMEAAGKGRVIVAAFGAGDCGIPSAWGAREDRAGVNLLADFHEEGFRQVLSCVAPIKRPYDVVVLSVHWGTNWGCRIPEEHRRFAHRVIENAGVDVVYGHSSHHPRAVEVHQGRLILYGCGDFLTDYEGIGGYEEFRGELGLIYFAAVDAHSGRLADLRMTPTRVRRMRIERAAPADAIWLRDRLNRESGQFGVRFHATKEGGLRLETAKAD